MNDPRMNRQGTDQMPGTGQMPGQRDDSMDNMPGQQERSEDRTRWSDPDGMPNARMPEGTERDGQDAGGAGDTEDMDREQTDAERGVFRKEGGA